jgi:hypothetical protein
LNRGKINFAAINWSLELPPVVIVLGVDADVAGGAFVILLSAEILIKIF